MAVSIAMNGIMAQRYLYVRLLCAFVFEIKLIFVDVYMCDVIAILYSYMYTRRRFSYFNFSIFIFSSRHRELFQIIQRHNWSVNVLLY